MRMPVKNVGDLWGGAAAVLVALPAAIAFGVTIYSPLGAEFMAQGALAGMLGAVALGLVAPMLGGTTRLISAPCAPAAAVLVAFALDFIQRGGDYGVALLLLSLLGIAAGFLQIVFGILGLGQLIVYMPYPVVSGYLSGVGLYIIAGQLPRFVGVPTEVHFWAALFSPSLWQWQSIIIGSVTTVVMLGAPRLTRRVPAAILALVAGILTYFGLAVLDPALLQLGNNSLVVGLVSQEVGGFSGNLMLRWLGLANIGPETLTEIAMPALTLAVLLSIDTLKTCVVLDALTRSRHDPNRELFGQGLGNIVSAVIGGIPGAGTMGATLVNLASGAQSRLSGLTEGILALACLLLLGRLIAWVPISALAAILMVVGLRMIDSHSLTFLRQRSTVLDFLVIAAVIATALTVSLIAASGVGVILAAILFIREQIGGAVVRRKLAGNQVFSKRVRTEHEMAILTEHGKRSVVVELQGSLFFGTSNQLYLALEADLKRCDFLILDMRRVQTVDVTAVHMLDLIKEMLAERHGLLIFSHLNSTLPSGRDMEKYFDQVGLVQPTSPVRVFSELDDALEWVEDRLIEAVILEQERERPLELHEIDLFRQRKPETLAILEACMEKRSYKCGERFFSCGGSGDELFIIRSGLVRIVLPISDKQHHHLGTFGRGAFFGEMAFLDGDVRSADAIAFSDTEVFVLSRKNFDSFAEEHRKLGLGLMEGLASVLARRLRYTNAELRALES